MVFVFTNCRKNAFRIELKLNPSSAAVFCASSLTFGSVLIKIVAVFIVLKSIANIYPLSRKHSKTKGLQPDVMLIIQGYRYLGEVIVIMVTATVNKVVYRLGRSKECSRTPPSCRE